MPSRMLSYAQNFEDVMLNRALGHLSSGFYVDVGAWDPDIESVTRHFYEKGWRGINIEPVPTYRKQLTNSRPRDINLFVAVGAKSGREIMAIVPGSGFSGLINSMDRNIKNKFSTTNVEVEVKTLNSIFEEFAPKEVHFLKIDCEGGESDIINHFDLTLFRPWIILVEAIEPASKRPNHHGWETHLTDAQYDFVYFDGLNRFYVARERKELASHFSTPPNILDEFRSIVLIPHGWRKNFDLNDYVSKIKRRIFTNILP